MVSQGVTYQYPENYWDEKVDRLFDGRTLSIPRRLALEGIMNALRVPLTKIARRGDHVAVNVDGLNVHLVGPDGIETVRFCPRCIIAFDGIHPEPQCDLGIIDDVMTS